MLCRYPTILRGCGMTPDSPVLTSETVGSTLLGRISDFPIRTLGSRITDTSHDCSRPE